MSKVYPCQILLFMKIHLSLTQYMQAYLKKIWFKENGLNISYLNIHYLH